MIKKMNDRYVNLFKEGYFWRAYEYSAMYLNDLKGYKLMLDVYKKEKFVCLVCGFADNLFDEVIENLNQQNV